jgi:hypothetical protein
MLYRVRSRTRTGDPALGRGVHIVTPGDDVTEQWSTLISPVAQTLGASVGRADGPDRDADIPSGTREQFAGGRPTDRGELGVLTNGDPGAA